MNPAEWLVRRARLSPQAPALFQHDQMVANYAAFAAHAGAIGTALLRCHGVGKGDRVAIFMKNRTEYLEAMYGIWFTGAAVVPINAKLHAKEAAWIMENARVRVAFVSEDLIGDLQKVCPEGPNTLIAPASAKWAEMIASKPLAEPAEIGPKEMIWLFYTSGTTGKPKGVMIPAESLVAMTLTYFTDVDKVTEKDAILYAAPMSHGAGIYNFMHVLTGARHVVPGSGGFDADEILDLAPQIRSVSMFAAPTMVKRLVERAKLRGMTGEGIRTIVYAGGPMYLADIQEAVEVMGNRFVQIYGQGECPMGITALPRHLVSDRSHPRWRERLASVGTAQSPVRVRIADSEGVPVPSGEIGEILVKGVTVMSGYWNNPEASAKTLLDGWLWTGDMGAMDSDGFVTLHDRSKDMIISGGSNIYPREVEEVLLQHPAVSEVAVVGRQHPDWGEEVVAFVVTSAGRTLSEEELDSFCIENIARFKRPKIYRFVPELPKNNYGKVLKTELRDWLRNLGR